MPAGARATSSMAAGFHRPARRRSASPRMGWPGAARIGRRKWTARRRADPPTSFGIGIAAWRCRLGWRLAAGCFACCMTPRVL
jgi:hypothetical protein